jgi:hypothetical protein
MKYMFATLFMLSALIFSLQASAHHVVEGMILDELWAIIDD